MRHRTLRGITCGLTSILIGCSDQSTGADAAADAAGVFTVHVPSTAAPGARLAVRVFHAASDQVRYAAGAPIVIYVPGGHSPGSLPPAATVPAEVATHGYVLVHFLMPGGATADASSSGAYDYRGPACKRALADVIRYTLGLEPDTDGQSLGDRLPSRSFPTLAWWVSRTAATSRSRPSLITVPR